jgi:pyruvate dehydrogenase E2 component (dihydrolipoamide acetyltransferase)
VGATPDAKKTLLGRTEREGNSPVAPRAAATRPTDRVLASPYVRKTARDLGLDLQGAHGSGPGGRIVPADLDALRAPRTDTQPPRAETQALARPAPSAALATRALAEPEVRPLSMMRKTIARRLTESKQTVPHFYLSIDVDADELMRLREHVNAELAASAGPAGANGSAKDASPTKISINDLLIKACATALVRVPECNAQFTPEAILVHRRVDISVAVAIAEGLVTPVVRNADQKTVVSLAREVRELAARARAKKLSPEEMMNGTFSISNLGMFGVDSFSAVINPPEGAILAVGQVRDAAVVRDGAVVAGKKLAMTLSCDHRVVDGAVGAAFLAELRSLLEHPMRILTG